MYKTYKLRELLPPGRSNTKENVKRRTLFSSIFWSPCSKFFHKKL